MLAGAETPTEKIAARHRDRRAYIYIRQSSAKQVQHHGESRRNQYALVERAVALGWAAERVHVIDVDLGQSGQDGSRPGFRELVAEVSLGRVGLVLAYEASRLARNNADWYALLDLAALRGTLIGDADGVYDPRTYNDRLLLGLRGMLSEAELHLIQLRLAAGRARQIERGAYRQHLPTGLVRLPDGRVTKDPDLQVQRTVELVLAHFAALGSCERVVRRLRDEGVRLPRRHTGGPWAGELLWKPPSEAAVHAILHNPAYAGAFVYGRHRRDPACLPGQHARRIHQPMAEWVTIQRDAYPAYLPWEAFVTNQERLADNAGRYAARRPGAVRAGPALLVGLVACGTCGRQLLVEYKTAHHYACAALSKEYGAPMCVYVDGPSLDAAVVDAFFAAVAPAELDLLDEVLAAQRTEHGRLAQQHADQVARAEYEARLAQRQYLAIDPDNRLVAAELERRWELALRALADARDAAERFAQTPAAPAVEPALRAQLRELSTQLPALWASGRLTPAQKKELLRALIRRVLVRRPRPDTVEATAVWVSGATTRLTVHPPVAHTADLSDYGRLVARALELVAAGHHDAAVARQLTGEGFRSARAKHVPTTLVTRLRRHHQQPSLTTRFRRQEQVDGQWTVWGLSRTLGVDRNWLYARIKAGTLPATRHPLVGHYLIPDDPAALERLRQQRPPRRPM
jgi:DNA invertase Pin-like site-specific DNA recombinase